MKRLSIYLLAGASLVLLTGCSNQPSYTVAQRATLAQCLTKAGVKMYGTPTCSHCLDQKAEFGTSFQYINYVDCSVTPDACSFVQGTPTWTLSGGATLL